MCGIRAIISSSPVGYLAEGSDVHQWSFGHSKGLEEVGIQVLSVFPDPFDPFKYWGCIWFGICVFGVLEPHKRANGIGCQCSCWGIHGT